VRSDSGLGTETFLNKFLCRNTLRWSRLELDSENVAKVTGM
jgi:hypothetical protein